MDTNRVHALVNGNLHIKLHAHTDEHLNMLKLTPLLIAHADIANAEHGAAHKTNCSR